VTQKKSKNRFSTGKHGSASLTTYILDGALDLSLRKSVMTGGWVIFEDPIGGWPMVNEVGSEEKMICNRRVQDVALLVSIDDITPQDRSELNFSTRTGTMKSSL
jgi:hypothetical protein